MRNFEVHVAISTNSDFISHNIKTKTQKILQEISVILKYYIAHLILRGSQINMQCVFAISTKHNFNMISVREMLMLVA